MRWTKHSGIWIGGNGVMQGFIIREKSGRWMCIVCPHGEKQIWEGHTSTLRRGKELIIEVADQYTAQFNLVKKEGV